MENQAFVEGVKGKQGEVQMTQSEFSDYLGCSQGALSKFYRRGIKDGLVIKILRRFPELGYLFASGDSNCT